MIFLAESFIHHVQRLIEDSDSVSVICVSGSDALSPNIIKLKHVGILVPGSRILAFVKI